MFLNIGVKPMGFLPTAISDTAAFHSDVYTHLWIHDEIYHFEIFKNFMEILNISRPLF